jgi:hypothetical protein
MNILSSNEFREAFMARYLHVVLPSLALFAVAVASSSAGAAGVLPDCGSGSGNVKDEAMCVGRTADSLPGADEDYFRDMDNGATKVPAALARDLAP